MRNITNIDIRWGTLWKIFGFFIIVAILYLSRQVIGALFFAVVLSLGIDPIVGFLEKKGIHRLIGTLLVFVIGFLAVFFGIYFMIPIFTIEASAFLKDFHEIVYSIFGVGLPDTLVDALTLGRDKVFEFLSSSDISVTKTLANFLTSGVFFIAVIIISFYLSVEKNGTERLLRVILPDEYEPLILKIFDRFKTKIRRWLAAQIGISFILGLVVWLGLWVMGIRYSLVLGALAAIFELVPVIGPILIGAVAFMIAVSDSFILGVYTILFFFIVQQLENHVLIPVVIGKTMKIHPIVVLVALLAGGKMAGFMGVLLAVPIAVMSQEIFNLLAERKEERLAAKDT